MTLFDKSLFPLVGWSSAWKKSSEKFVRQSASEANRGLRPEFIIQLTMEENRGWGLSV